MEPDHITFRAAGEADLVAIVAMLADDDIGKLREDPSVPLASAYVQAFAAIKADANQLLAVAVDSDGVIVGSLQLTFIPGFARRGAWRGEIEAVRIAKDRRGFGLGQQMIQWAISQCRERGCSLVQLTMDKARTDSHRFYEKLGFVASHEGFKLKF